MAFSMWYSSNFASSEHAFNRYCVSDGVKDGKRRYSNNRFELLLTCLRFYNKDTPDKRLPQNKFAPMKEVWDSFIANCGPLYVPTENLSIDEQLLGFRGRCEFRMYIPNKLANYGIKLVLICESESKYLLGATTCMASRRQGHGMGSTMGTITPENSPAPTMEQIEM